MPDLGIQKMKPVLQAHPLDFCICSGIQLCPFPAMTQIDLVNILHQVKGFLFSDMLIQRSAELIGDVIFPVRKSTGSAEPAHDAADRAADTCFDFITVNRAFSLFQRTAEFKDGNLQIAFCQFIGRKNAAGTCSDNNHIVIHENTFLNSRRLWDSTGVLLKYPL